MPPFIDRAQPLLPQAAAMAVTYAAMCFLNHLMLAFASGKVRRFLSSQKRMLAVRRVLGSMFIGSARRSRRRAVKEANWWGEGGRLTDNPRRTR